MTSLRCHMVWLWVVFTLAVNATPTYQVPNLERLAHSIGLNLPDKLEPDADYDATWSYRGRSLRVRTNVRALEEDVLKPEDKAEATSRKDIIFLKGNATMLKTLTPETPFSLNEQERRTYLMEWGKGSGQVSLRISADCQTLLGANLIELEEMLERDLRRTASALPVDTVPETWRSCPVSTADNVAVADGGTFLCDLICARLYLCPDDMCPGGYRVLTDPTHPNQALNNLLLTGCARYMVSLRLTLDKYGGIRKPLSVTLQQFVHYCNTTGCRLYLGIKERTDTGVSATLFAVNTKLAYCHTLSLIVPYSVLQGNSIMAGTLYAFTPLQNVTENFFMNNP